MFLLQYDRRRESFIIVVVKWKIIQIASLQLLAQTKNTKLPVFLAVRYFISENGVFYEIGKQFRHEKEYLVHLACNWLSFTK